MLKRFKVKDLLVIAVSATLTFVLSLMIGQWLVIATEIPFIGGIITGIIIALIGTICYKIVNKFGTLILLYLITSILASPTTFSGPPGIYKIIIYPVTFGLTVDLIIKIFKKRNSGIIVGWIVGAIFTLLAAFYAITLLGLPGAEKMGEFLFILMSVNITSCIIGAILGLWLFKKIKDKRIIRQLST